jgi:hypothetical protein
MAQTHRDSAVTFSLSRALSPPIIQALLLVCPALWLWNSLRKIR